MDTKRKIITAVDICIFSAALLLAALLFFWPKGSGAVAVVFADGQEIKRLPLAEITQNFKIETNGVTVCFEQGKVWVETSTCPDKLCVHFGKLSKPGNFAVCAPNRVSIEILGSEEPDSVAY
jgi:hypothetical protein